MDDVKQLSGMLLLEAYMLHIVFENLQNSLNLKIIQDWRTKFYVGIATQLNKTKPPSTLWFENTY